jgi:hypothetical protein
MPPMIWLFAAELSQVRSWQGKMLIQFFVAMRDTKRSEFLQSQLKVCDFSLVNIFYIIPEEILCNFNEIFITTFGLKHV